MRMGRLPGENDSGRSLTARSEDQDASSLADALCWSRVGGSAWVALLCGLRRCAELRLWACAIPTHMMGDVYAR